MFIDQVEINNSMESSWSSGPKKIGFYKGFVHTWLACCKRNEKVKVKLEALSKLLDQDWSDMTRDLVPELQCIRAKFKQICSMLNVNIEHTAKNAATQLTF